MYLAPTSSASQVVVTCTYDDAMATARAGRPALVSPSAPGRLNEIDGWLRTGPGALLGEVVLVGLGLLPTHLLPWQTLGCGCIAAS